MRVVAGRGGGWIPDDVGDLCSTAPNMVALATSRFVGSRFHRDLTPASHVVTETTAHNAERRHIAPPTRDPKAAYGKESGAMLRVR